EPGGESLQRATLPIHGEHAQAFSTVGKKLHPHESGILGSKPGLRQAIDRTLVPKDACSTDKQPAGAQAFEDLKIVVVPVGPDQRRMVPHGSLKHVPHALIQHSSHVLIGYSALPSYRVCRSDTRKRNPEPGLHHPEGKEVRLDPEVPSVLASS